jgi:hypothetical protein
MVHIDEIIDMHMPDSKIKLTVAVNNLPKGKYRIRIEQLPTTTDIPTLVTNKMHNFYWSQRIAPLASFLGYTKEELHEALKLRLKFSSIKDFNSKEAFLDFLVMLEQYVAEELNFVYGDKYQ